MEEVKKNNDATFEDDEARIEQIVFGWSSIDDAARDLFASLHRRLLEGTPVFLFRNTNTKSDLVQVAIVANLDDATGNPTGDYGVGIMTTGYSAYYPKMPLEFLEGDIRSDLAGWKIEKRALETYDKIIKVLRNNGSK